MIIALDGTGTVRAPPTLGFRLSSRGDSQVLSKDRRPRFSGGIGGGEMPYLKPFVDPVKLGIILSLAKLSSPILCQT